MKHLLSLTLLAFVFCGNVSAQSYKKLMEKGDECFATNPSKTVEFYEKALTAAKSETEKGIICCTMAEKFMLSSSEAEVTFWHKRGAEYNNCKSLVYLGDTRIARNDFEGASEYFRKAADQGDMVATIRLALMCYRMGDKQKARDYVEKYASLYGDKSKTYYSIGLALSPAGENYEYGSCVCSFHDDFDGNTLNTQLWTVDDKSAKALQVNNGVLHEFVLDEGKTVWYPYMMSPNIPMSENVIIENNVSAANYPEWRKWASLYHRYGVPIIRISFDNVRYAIVRCLYGGNDSYYPGRHGLTFMHSTYLFELKNDVSAVKDIGPVTGDVYSKGRERIVVHKSTAMLEYFIGSHKVFERKLDEKVKEAKTLNCEFGFGGHITTSQDIANITIESRDGKAISSADTEEAIYWYKKSVDNGYKMGYLGMSTIYYASKKYDLHDDCVIQYLSDKKYDDKINRCMALASQYKEMNDDKRVVKWYEMAKKYGDAQAMNKLAKLYNYQEMVEDFDEVGEAVMRIDSRKGAVVNRSMKKLKEIDL